MVKEVGGVGKIFPHSELKRSFATARDLAGIDGLRWHDLRHTAITWMLASIKDSAEVIKISGHKEWSTFLRYVYVNGEMAREMAALMDARRDGIEAEKKDDSGFVN